MKISKSIQTLVEKFLNVSAVKSAVDITKIKELLNEDTNLRNKRFDNLCALSVQCYNFKKFWSLATTKQLRKDHKCDIKVEDAINVIFGYNKAYFYRLATMGETVVMKPNLVAKFKKQNDQTSGEYVMDALTFNAFAKDGELKVKQKPQQQTQQEPQNDESDVTGTQNPSSVTEQKDEIVFHLLCDERYARFVTNLQQRTCIRCYEKRQRCFAISNRNNRWAKNHNTKFVSLLQVVM